MKISFLGACNEVGSSGILVDTGTEKILMDYGIKIQENPIQYPEDVREKVSCILLTHAHLDHSGGIPYLFNKGQNCPLMGQDITKPFSKMLWYDSLKIASMDDTQIRFSEKDIKRSLRKYNSIEYRKPFSIGKTKIMALDAGHIPGSCMFLLETQNKRILYTGDFNTEDTRLIRGCDWEVPKVDILITESTYAGKEHPEREKEEGKFAEMVRETLLNDGVVVISSFAIARAQEVLLILENFGFKSNIFIDGMTQKATNIINKYPHLQKRYNSVKSSLKKMKVRFIQHPAQRKRVIKKPSIIITTSGMLSGGAVVYYLKHLHDRENCSLILTGFQVPDCEGDRLLKTGRYVYGELDLKVKMNVKKFDFSAHSSDSNLLEFIERVRPKKVFCVHGDSTPNFSERLCSMGFKAEAPFKGQEIEV
ncbi:MAG: MBL fold metallo-hydrolase [Candidatus Aenigmatarchaeota archaeon]